MIERDYFSHTIPGYGKVWDKLHAIGYCYKVGGENIGWNNYPDDIATAAHPQDVHGLVGPPRQHPGQGLGRHRHRRLQGPDRQEDVDRPVRRQVRLDRAQADRQADAQADHEADRRSRPPAQGRRRGRRRDRPAKPRQGDAGTDTRPRRPHPPPSRRRRSPATTSSRRATSPRPNQATSPRSTRPTTRAPGSTAPSACASSIARSTDGLLSTIVGGVTGFFFGG